MKKLFSTFLVSTTILGAIPAFANSSVCPSLSKNILQQVGFLSENGEFNKDVEQSVIDDGGPAEISGIIYKKGNNEVLDESLSSLRTKGRVAYITVLLNKGVEYIASMQEDKTYINFTAEKNFTIRTDTNCKIDYIGSFDPKVTNTNIGNSISINANTCKKLNAGKSLKSVSVEQSRGDGEKFIEKQYVTDGEDGWISESRLSDAKTLCEQYSNLM